ncbi:MAG: IclR family transcriptional regulator [Firmicutes bacterium]|jgi:DNA-binding IclR family transcriptional regulator|uniref:IclR family transcriptional regulator n=1 Tax=Sulfobacillus benefaciens TaxID=453960 RepID=A0A2T2X9V9_9FIRM|nr:IclR family transcriptional regulator [Bacillota bacterium]MCL5013310.1 IclR family transcriptional regulator [Bacillota bacterium]PSR31269.1 MAG: hypothetical protein C7B43_02555 [Sulfobacillus benefaciens]
MEGLVKSADRVVTVLSAVAEIPGGLSFTELLNKTGIPKSSLHGIIQTLVADSMITYDELTRVYYFGPRLWELAMKYYDRLHLVPLAWPYIEQLRDTCGQTVQMAVLDGQDVLYVAKAESHRPLQMASYVGSRLPAYATGLGKALLATLTDSRLRTIFPQEPWPAFTKNTITRYDELIQKLKHIREQGFAEDMGEYSPDIRCIAYPVLGLENRGVAAVSVSVSADEFSSVKIHDLVRVLRKQCHLMARRLGSTDPEAWRQSADTDSSRAVREKLL